jgi:hypothetical protein
MMKTLAAPATFQERYQLIKARHGERVELHCDCSGELPLRSNWFKDGKSLLAANANSSLNGVSSATGHRNGNGNAMSTGDGSSAETAGSVLFATGAEMVQLIEQLKEQRLSSRLQLPPLGKHHTGLYLCVAENAFGRDEKHIELLVQGKPSLD